MIKIVYSNLFLFKELVKKDIKQKYQGSMLGVLWTFLSPLLMLTIYTFVFSEVFQAKWDIDTSDKYQFALTLFCGLCVFNLLSEVMNRSTSLIASNTNYVKKVIFPLEIMPVVITFSAFFSCLISIAILVVARLIIYHYVSRTIYMIFLAFMPLLFLTTGCGMLISSLSVYVKDMSNIISILVTILMYVSPVFFPLSAVPASFRSFCELNPMTYIIESFRKVLLLDQPIEWKQFILSCLISIAIYFVGKFVFMRTKEGFADVL